jgi:hypothetical protein
MNELLDSHARLICPLLALLVCTHGCGRNNAHTSKPDKPDDTTVPVEARTIIDHPARHIVLSALLILNIRRVPSVGFCSSSERNMYGILGYRQPAFDVAVSALACPA